MAARKLIWLLLLSALPVLAAPQQSAPAKTTPAETAAKGPQTAEMVTAAGPVSVELFQDYYRMILSYHPLLTSDGASKEMIAAALFDVEAIVSEMDNRFATDQLFLKDAKALDEMKRILAMAHFQCSILGAKGVDLEGSISQYEKVVELLGFDPADWDQKVERSGHQGLLPNAADTIFDIASPRDIVEDLKVFWSAGVVTRFRIRDYSPAQRSSMKLERVGGATDGFSLASFGLGTKRFNEQMEAGIDEFRVVLPPGHYRVSSSEAGFHTLEFVLVAGGIPDPLVLNPNSFNFAFSTTDEKCRPALFLNGLPVHQLNDLPFGTYRVEAPKTCTLRLPNKITVEQKAEVTLRTEPERLESAREGQPIFMFITTPPQSTYTLRM